MEKQTLASRLQIYCCYGLKDNQSLPWQQSISTHHWCCSQSQIERLIIFMTWLGKKSCIEAHAAELLAYLESEGISSTDLTLLPHSFDPNALILDQAAAISAYSTDEPFLLKQAGLEYLIFNPRASGIDFYGDTLFTTETQIKDNPERVKAFVDASLRGWAYALDHPDEVVDLIYSEYTQRHSKEHLLFEAEKTKQLILPDVVEIGYMNPGRWQRIAEIYTEMNMTPEKLSLDNFIYNPNPRPDLTWLYLSLLGAFYRHRDFILDIGSVLPP